MKTQPVVACTARVKFDSGRTSACEYQRVDIHMRMLHAISGIGFAKRAFSVQTQQPLDRMQSRGRHWRCQSCVAGAAEMMVGESGAECTVWTLCARSRVVGYSLEKSLVTSAFKLRVRCANDKEGCFMRTATQVAHCLLLAHTRFLWRTHARTIIKCCPQTIRRRTVYFCAGSQVGIRHKTRSRCTIPRPRLCTGIRYRERGIVIQRGVAVCFLRPVLQTCRAHNMALEQLQ